MYQDPATTNEDLAAAIKIAKANGHKVLVGHRVVINSEGQKVKTNQEVYSVRSHTDKNCYHILYVNKGALVCDCHEYKGDLGPGTQHHHGVCSHRAAVYLFLKDRAAKLVKHLKKQAS